MPKTKGSISAQAKGACGKLYQSKFYSKGPKKENTNVDLQNAP